MKTQNTWPGFKTINIFLKKGFRGWLVVHHFPFLPHSPLWLHIYYHYFWKACPKDSPKRFHNYKQRNKQSHGFNDGITRRHRKMLLSVSESLPQKLIKKIKKYIVDHFKKRWLSASLCETGRARSLIHITIPWYHLQRWSSSRSRHGGNRCARQSQRGHS